jgi:hypothetical protein
VGVADFFTRLYFKHFNKHLPFLHQPTFSPHKTLAQQLLLILGIGALYAPLPGILQFGRVLVEVARRGLEHQISRDNRLARSLPVVSLDPWLNRLYSRG